MDTIRSVQDSQGLQVCTARRRAAPTRDLLCTVKVIPGVHNLGIFVTLHHRDESYRLTHPSAHLGGFLRGALTIYVEDLSYIVCAKNKLRCILQYLGDGWLGKAKHRVEGVIYWYDDETEDLERPRDVPERAILARIDGSWVGQLYYTLTGSKVC